MRAATQIFPRALPINRNRLLGRNGFNNLSLIGLANLAKMRHRVIAVPFLADNILIAVNDFLHALFNRLKVIKAERRLAGKIIIKAVFNHRPNGHLRARKKLLHGLGQNMRAIMAHQFHALRIGGGHHRHFGIAIDRHGQIGQRAIDFPCQGFLAQRV